MPGVPLGSFPGIIYDEVTLELTPDDLFVFCTDGLFEALNPMGAEFGARRLCDVVAASRKESARGIVDEIFHAVTEFRGSTPQADDMTAVAIKIQ